MLVAVQGWKRERGSEFKFKFKFKLRNGPNGRKGRKGELKFKFRV